MTKYYNGIVCFKFFSSSNSIIYSASSKYNCHFKKLYFSLKQTGKKDIKSIMNLLCRHLSFKKYLSFSNYALRISYFSIEDRQTRANRKTFSSLFIIRFHLKSLKKQNNKVHTFILSFQNNLKR